MLYSRWRPDKGGFDYFESGERFGLGDDLPTPDLSGGTAIGVSSIKAGRLPKNGSLTPAGSGAFARGMVMPTSRDGLQGLGVFSNLSTGAIALLAAVGGYLACHFLKERG